jgi:hypothetical protein
MSDLPDYVTKKEKKTKIIKEVYTTGFILHTFTVTSN